jgi:hypothetical protein
MNRQIEKMLAAEKDPRRIARMDGIDLPWTSAVFAVVFALGKFSRIVKFSGQSISIQAVDKRHTAEECREAAHYLLRAAELLEHAEDEEALS